MVSKNFLWASMALGMAAAQNKNGQNNNNGATATSGNNAQAVLDSAVIQSGSFLDGSTGLGAEATQAKSQTSTNNFINFCQGKTLTNGLQITGGSCNGIVMGDIPAKNTMISSILINPKNNDQIQAGKDFQIQVQTSNLVAGSFTNAQTTYYAAPQTLQGGKVVGHTHVTVQDLGKSQSPTTPLDPTQFAFFKGINDAGNGNGLLSANVTGGLPAGNYRVCTLTSASNHQPVIMPVAQRGSQDDCNKFTVVGNGGSTNAAASDGSGGEAAAAEAQQAVNLGPGGVNTTATSTQNNGQQTQNQGSKQSQAAQQNQGQKGQGQQAQKGQGQQTKQGQGQERPPDDDADNDDDDWGAGVQN